MSTLPHDINDDEIRIISSNTPTPTRTPSKRRNGRRGVITAAIIVACAAVVGLVLFFAIGHDEPQNVGIEVADDAYIDVNASPTVTYAEKETETTEPVATPPKIKPFVVINDTTVNNRKFIIYTPMHGTPRLHVGTDILNDTTATFVVQAADVRRDNGKIVGAYILDGELLSKGQAKSGYCAIIGGKISVGVAESTPLLEQALESNGYFFRQYPLVIANQVVENKPKNRSQRKALAELNGEIVVIMSEGRLTFHDFSQALVDMGVTNAIYLVGSSTYGFAKDADGNKFEFGKPNETGYPFTNYIVWE